MRWALASAALVVAACTTTGSPTGTPIAQTAPTPSATSAATSSPSAIPSLTPATSGEPPNLCANVEAVEIKTCELAPGTYSSAPFTPIFDFTIGAGWTNVLAGTHAGSLTRGEPTVSQFSWATGMKMQDGTDLGTADAFFGFLTSQPGVTASAPVPVMIGGKAGSSMDFRTSGDQDVVFSVAKAAYLFFPGTQVRAIVVDVDGSLVLLAIEVFGNEDFETEMTDIQPILDSIVWG